MFIGLHNSIGRYLVHLMTDFKFQVTWAWHRKIILNHKVKTVCLTSKKIIGSSIEKTKKNNQANVWNSNVWNSNVWYSNVWHSNVWNFLIFRHFCEMSEIKTLCLDFRHTVNVDSSIVSHSQTVPISDTFFCLKLGQKS